LLRDDISDPVDIDILATLIETPNCRKRSSDIEKELVDKYKNSYNKNSFHTHFNRCIKRLCSKEMLERKAPDHQQVFYSIPDSQRESIRVELRKIKNVKLFTQLDLEEQQRLISEVNLLRKRELTRNLMDMPLPGYAIVSMCQKMGLNYQDFEPCTWGSKVVWWTEEAYKLTFPPFDPKSDRDFYEIELKTIPQPNTANLTEGKKIERMALHGWCILGTSREKIALCCRLKVLALSIENTIEAYIEYLKEFFPPEKWGQLEDLRKDPWIVTSRLTPTVKTAQE
jgi:hypothetical protein